MKGDHVEGTALSDSEGIVTSSTQDQVLFIFKYLVKNLALGIRKLIAE